MEIQTIVQLITRPGERRIPRWRFVLPLMIQVLLVLAVPMPRVAAYATGTTAYLEVGPVDPYDLLRGRYIRLDYPLERLSALEGLPGWRDAFAAEGRTLYVTLVPREGRQAFRPVAIAEAYPAELPPGAVALSSRMADHSLRLGLGEYHIPEDVGDEAERAMGQARSATRAEVRVDGRGNAVLTGLWVGSRRY